MALRPTQFLTSTRLAALFATTVMSTTGASAATKSAMHKNAPSVHETKPKKLAPQIQQDPEEIKVSADRPLAGGLMKKQHAPEATNSISALAIQQRGAASSPLQIAASLPGVNFGSSDAYGLSVRNNISVRGLDSTEMGWTIEGAPGVDQAYYWPYTETWADNENISDITLIAGTSRINDPVQTASGGEMIETVRDPSRKRGADVDYSYGSFRGQRIFGRVDSGEIGHSGVRLLHPIHGLQQTTSLGLAEIRETTWTSRRSKNGVIARNLHFSFRIRIGITHALRPIRSHLGKKRINPETIFLSIPMRETILLV